MNANRKDEMRAGGNAAGSPKKNNARLIIIESQSIRPQLILKPLFPANLGAQKNYDKYRAARGA